MALTIPDEVVQDTGLSERQFLIEVACRMFADQLMSKAAASRLCGLNRVDFEAELYRRNLPVYIYTEEMLKQDLEYIHSFEAGSAGR